MKNSKNPKLKPCPHCGNEAKEEQTRGSFGGYGLKTVYCQSCSSSSTDIKTWNMRMILIKSE